MKATPTTLMKPFSETIIRCWFVICSDRNGPVMFILSRFQQSIFTFDSPLSKQLSQTTAHVKTGSLFATKAEMPMEFGRVTGARLVPHSFTPRKTQQESPLEILCPSRRGGAAQPCVGLAQLLINARQITVKAKLLAFLTAHKLKKNILHARLL